MGRFLRSLAAQAMLYEPAVLGWALNGGLAVLLGSVFHISATQEAAVTTIVTAAVGVYTWATTRDRTVSGLTGFISTIAVAATAFGLHLSAAETGAGVALLSGVIALVLRQNVTPVAQRPAP